MNSIGKIISVYRKKRKMSQTQLAEELNTHYGHSISNKAVSKWETDAAQPGITLFYDICRILRITDMYGAYFGENPDNPLSGLNEAGQERVVEYAALLSGLPKYQKKIEVPVSGEKKVIPYRTIPMQLYPVSAGPGNFLDDENYEDISVSPEVPASADFAVRVSGNSMEPLFHKNQIIYVHRQDTLSNGEIGIFFLDGEAYVKKFQNDQDGTYLISLNELYAPKPVTEQSDFRIFGKVVYY